jgi:hypothetical protein
MVRITASFRRSAAVALAASSIILAATPVSAAGPATVDRIEDIDTVLAVRFGDDFPVASLMRATCDWAQFVERPDGSGIEKLHCELSAEAVMIPEFQGSPPATAFIHGGGPCLWTSDYWFAKEGSIVMAESFSYVVTPSGLINITAEYPAAPLACE